MEIFARKGNILTFNFETQVPGSVQDRIRQAARSLRLAHNMTQQALALKSGVPLSTLKRFEQSGEISLAALMAIAGALDALAEFDTLFPKPAAATLDELGSVGVDRKRATKRQN